MSFAVLLAAALSQIDRAYIHETLHLTDYKAAQVDLDGDGRAEILVYAEGPERCGSGGCDLYVLAHRGDTLRVVTSIAISRPPVRVLSTVTHGWHDLSVTVAGGGIIRAYAARLQFNGTTYPGNPTVAPATRLRRVIGRIVIR